MKYFTKQLCAMIFIATMAMNTVCAQDQTYMEQLTSWSYNKINAACQFVSKYKKPIAAFVGSLAVIGIAGRLYYSKNTVQNEQPETSNTYGNALSKLPTTIKDVAIEEGTNIVNVGKNIVNATKNLTKQDIKDAANNGIQMVTDFPALVKERHAQIGQDTSYVTRDENYEYVLPEQAEKPSANYLGQIYTTVTQDPETTVREGIRLGLYTIIPGTTFKAVKGGRSMVLKHKAKKAAATAQNKEVLERMIQDSKKQLQEPVAIVEKKSLQENAKILLNNKHEHQSTTHINVNHLEEKGILPKNAQFSSNKSIDLSHLSNQKKDLLENIKHLPNIDSLPTNNQLFTEIHQLKNIEEVNKKIEIARQTANYEKAAVRIVEETEQASAQVVAAEKVVQENAKKASMAVKEIKKEEEFYQRMHKNLEAEKNSKTAMQQPIFLLASNA